MRLIRVCGWAFAKGRTNTGLPFASVRASMVGDVVTALVGDERLPFGLPFFGGIGLPSSSVSSAVVERETFVEPAVAVVIVEREHEFVSVAERPCADGLGSF